MQIEYILEKQMAECYQRVLYTYGSMVPIHFYDLLDIIF